jgi:hypothetical protein
MYHNTYPYHLPSGNTYPITQMPYFPYIFIFKNEERAEDVAQVTEDLPCKCQALSSNSSAAKKKKERKKEKNPLY